MSYAGQSKSFFDVIVDVFYDTILPLNGLMVCLFVSFRWKHHNLSQELKLGNNGYAGSWLEKYMRFSLSSFIPAILLLIFCNTVAQKFFAFSLFGLWSIACDGVTAGLLVKADYLGFAQALS